MILFSHAKINIGLQILEKRSDGFHNLCSVMYPVGLCDILEVKPSPGLQEEFQLSQSGRLIDSDPEANLVTKAWRAFSEHSTVAPLKLHLHKQIPAGAGLGGGSSNASITLKALNHLAGESIAPDQLEKISAQLGSDCPFFLHKGPRMMEGRGEILRDTKVSLKAYYLVLLFPEIHISTADAYAGVTPRKPEEALETMVSKPIEQWKHLIANDFESKLASRMPLIAELKSELYEAGAVYASLNGSGSSLYGIFRKRPALSAKLTSYLIWEGPA